MKFKNFTLDPFQEDSVHSLENGNSVIVSAATGTGKTLIAEYLIEKCIKEGKRAVYTAPIKALSNQKYRDFKRDYGDRVGIMTGDVVINETADILIMTTEVYRNMLLTRDDMISDLSYVIFDEIHYINDFERGTVWEESVIFSPNWIRFLCLSATIPNARQFADWIGNIKEHTVDVVRYDKRAVPLEHHIYDDILGMSSPEKLKDSMELDSYPKYDNVYPGRNRGKGRRGKRGDVRFNRHGKKMGPKPVADHLDLVGELKADDQVPCIFFTFSRKDCMNLAQDASKKFDFLDNKETQEALTIFNKTIEKEIKNMRSVRAVRSFVERGVGVHHAGLLPSLKLAVEMLFERGLIKVLYATETFAVGINMPARSVAFNSMMKYDGLSFRHIHTKEYFQMAGRAGRRGIDDIGHVYILIDRNKLDAKKILDITAGDTEPIVSQFKLSYNTLLNLKKHYDETRIKEVLKKNFGYYVAKMSHKQIRIMTSYRQMLKTLERMEYIKDEFLTKKGEFACLIYAHELVISEMLYSNMFQDLDEVEICIALSAVMYEEKRSDKFKINNNIGHIMDILNRNRFVRKKVKRSTLKNLYRLVSMWATESDFDELMQVCNMEEGHIIRFFRQTIDMLAQIRKACPDPELKEKFTRCIELLDRDIIAVTF